MFRYTTRYVNIVSLLVTLIIFCITNHYQIISNKFNLPLNLNIFKINPIVVELSSNNINQNTSEKEIQNNIEIQNNQKNLITNEKNNKNQNWIIKIPKISLEAEISEGTSKEIMDKFVGHFEETTKISGNVGLAAHNRGYSVNYFKDIKLLKEGDKIIYKYNGIERTYSVIENKIIKDTDWSLLEETQDNRITLITCVENEPEYRRCVQAIEK